MKRSLSIILRSACVDVNRVTSKRKLLVDYFQSFMTAIFIDILYYIYCYICHSYWFYIMSLYLAIYAAILCHYIMQLISLYYITGCLTRDCSKSTCTGRLSELGRKIPQTFVKQHFTVISRNFTRLFEKWQRNFLLSFTWFTYTYVLLAISCVRYLVQYCLNLRGYSRTIWHTSTQKRDIFLPLTRGLSRSRRS